MKNNRKHSLYICMEILIIGISILMGVLAYNYVIEIEPSIKTGAVVIGMLLGATALTRLHYILDDNKDKFNKQK